MPKVAIIADTHYGVRGDNQLFYDYFQKFYENVFFPYIDNHSIDTVIHLGDVVDRRKNINYVTARRLHRDLIEPMFSRNLDIHVIIGNHDVPYKDTNEVNSMSELYGTTFYEKLHVYSRPKDVEVHGTQIAMLPWICQDTYDDSIEMLATSKSSILMGHLDLSGFEEYRGHVSENRMDPNLLQRFDVVLSGHFHHRSTSGNISYVGSTAQHNWSDYDDPRGFAVFDTETREIVYVDNPYEIFKKVFYDDSDKTVDQVLEVDEFDFKDSYVKLIVENKTNPYLFDLYVDKLQSCGAHDVQVIESVQAIEDLGDDEIVDGSDTNAIIKQYIASLDTTVSKKLVESFFETLYSEALAVT